MRRRLRIRPEARADIAQASNFFHAQSPEREQRFLDVLDAALDYIEDFPLANAVRFDDVRRAAIRGFAYALLYTVTEENDEQEILVTDCIHERSDPQTWRKLN